MQTDLKRPGFVNIYQAVKTIPAGKVATYGQIAKKLGLDPRMVGWALHANSSAEVPCHRVVNKDGRLAPNFAFDGWKEQRRRLIVEGVTFVDEMHVDLSKHLYAIVSNSPITQSAMSRAHVFISGDIIGVGFRAWTVREAKKLNLMGWVRNIYPKVEAIFAGTKEDVEKMIENCHDGPEVGFVENVEVTWEDYQDEFSDFSIL